MKNRIFKMVIIYKEEDWEDFKLAVKSLNSTITAEINDFIKKFNRRYRTNINLMKGRRNKLN